MKKNILPKFVFLFLAADLILLSFNFLFYNQNRGVSAQGLVAQEPEEKCVIDPAVENGFERGKIPIGELVDYAELYAATTSSFINDMIENAQAAADAAYDKKTDQDLYDLPPKCKCLEKCTPVCYNCVWFIVCLYCSCRCEGECCPPEIAIRVNEIKDAYDKIETANNNIANLVTAEGKITDEYGNEIDIPDALNRWKLLNALTNSRNKLEECILGYGKVLKPAMTRMTLLDCEIALDKIYTGKLVILFGFDKFIDEGHPEQSNLCFENLAPERSDLCYPYNSKQFLNDDQRKICKQNKDSPQCREIIKDLMQNFFCCEGKMD